MEQEFINLLLPENSEANLQLADPSLVQFYSDIENRTYWIEGEISVNQLDLFSKIVDWNKEDQFVAVEDRKPIKIIINSEGGALATAQTLTDLFSLSKTPIYTYAIGLCASAASLIFLAGHRKFALPNVTFIFHRGGCNNLGGDYNQINQFMEDYKRQIKELEKFYQEKTKYTSDFISEKMNQGDWYIKIDEALENGVVDQIITDIEDLF